MMIPLHVRLGTPPKTHIQHKNIHIKEIAGQFHVGTNPRPARILEVRRRSWPARWSVCFHVNGGGEGTVPGSSTFSVFVTISRISTDYVFRSFESWRAGFEQDRLSAIPSKKR